MSAPAAAATATGTATGRRTRFHPLRVAAVDRLTDDAAAITFAVPEDLSEEFAFAPGQSLTLRRQVDGIEQRRTYSICSPAGTAPRVGVREVPDGLFSTWLVRRLRPGETVEVQPPSGSFAADVGTSGRHLCIGAGSGITPLLSIAASALRDPGSRVTLLYGNRTAGSVMFAEELADLKDSYPARFDLVHVLSREPREVELFSGRLDADRLRTLVRALVPVAQVDHVWLCGPLGMTTAARDALVELGVPPERVHRELFFVDEPPPQLRHTDAVPDGVTTDLTVVLDGRSSTHAVPRETPLLDSAQRHRADLPFACKGGVCGTCRARVRTGEVDMVRNYALEEAEVADGFVLTCQTFPVGATVTVDYDS